MKYRMLNREVQNVKIYMKDRMLNHEFSIQYLSVFA